VFTGSNSALNGWRDAVHTPVGGTRLSAVSDTPDRTAVEQWNTLELDELLRLIAQETSSGGVSGDPNQQRDWGLAVVRAWFRSIRARICGGSAADRENVFEFVNDLALVADLATALFGGVPTSQLAVAAYKYGVRTLCAETA